MQRTVSGTRYPAFGRPRYGLGSQVGRVGLDEHPVERHPPERLAQGFGVPEG